jgi:hypothetical protein
MQFKVIKDSGNLIAGWMTSDDPLAAPTLLLSAPGSKEVEVVADRQGSNRKRNPEKRRDSEGTDRARFRITESVFPALATATDLEIRDAKSRVLLYRRSQPEQHLAQKIFRYELQGMPRPDLDNIFNQNFTVVNHAVERLPPNTLACLVDREFATSVYLAGRPPLPRLLQQLKGSDFKVVTLLRDPYEEMAERLLFLSYAANKELPPQFSDRLTGLTSLVEFARQFDQAEDEDLVTLFKTISGEQQRALSNPFVRALACEGRDTPAQRHVSIALNNLSSLNLVGLMTHFKDFKSSFAEIVEADILGDCEITQASWVSEAAPRLAEIDEVTELILLDIELYNYARDAIKSALEAA